METLYVDALRFSIQVSKMETELIQLKIKCFGRIITPNLSLSNPVWVKHLICRKSIRRVCDMFIKHPCISSLAQRPQSMLESGFQ